ncbi:NADH dehydrogenase [ubiquinone] flavoprotein 3, mitochondrial [Tiliqua scincoides]|uniref:NADH dehydrogenase [ubiquinone] flavoprotein 3, mitochondrial n=1 Tax=Tiliqua scincoides TaxID=71010 RepID=UPI00346332E3
MSAASLTPRRGLPLLLGSCCDWKGGGMAAALLSQAGRVLAFKTLQLQAWGLQRLPTTVFLCTKSEEPKKYSAKHKGEAISSTKPDGAVKLADEDLRKFLARKTLVTFPQKTLARESVSSSTGKKLADEESSSSSSSDSDSSSDSEEEVNALKDTVKTKVSFPRRDPICFENRTKKIKIRTEKHFPQEQDKDSAPYSLSSAESSVKQKGLHQTTADNKLLKSDLAIQPTIQRPDETFFKSINLEIKLAGQQKSTEVASKQVEASLPEVTASKLSRTPSRPQQNVAQNPTLLKQEKNAAVEIQETELQGTDTTVQQEEALNDRTSVVETMKEGIIPEAGVQSEQQSIPQGAKPTVAIPQEDFDISTYKNLQHHEYTPFTFVDYDVELSKFRLPQPSSGRISPWH